MAGIVEDILIRIQASVSGAAGVAGLTGGIGGLTSKLLGLNAGLQIVQQVTGAVGGMVSQLEDWADAANRAATNTKVFELTLGRFNIATDQANGAAERLAKQFGLSVTDIQDSMTTLIRAGFRDIGQLEATMRGAGASAIAAGRDAKAGFGNIADAAATGLSSVLNSIGISQNISTYTDKLAKSLGKTADALTDTERAQALYNLVLEATGTEVEALGSIQNDYVRSQQQSRLASENLSRALGEIAMPIVVRYKTATTEVTKAVIEAVRAYQQGGDAVKVLADKYPQLARVMEQLKPIADAMQRGLTDAWRAITDFATRTLYPMFEAVRPLVERVWAQVPGIIQSAGHLIGETFRLLADLWERVLKPVWDSIAPAVEFVFANVGSVLKGAFDFISGIFTAIRALIHGDWVGAWETAKEAVAGAVEKVRSVLEGLGSKIDTALSDLAQRAITAGRNFGLNLQDAIISGVSGLAERLVETMDAAVERMTARIPPWLKDRLGITALTTRLETAAGTAADNGAAARERTAERSNPGAVDPATVNGYNGAVLTAALRMRGDRLADSVVDYCARWVRDTLGDAAPAMRGAIDKLFQSNPEIFTNADGKTVKTPTARSAYGNFQAAGLARDYKTFADLKPGDTVFYVDGGQNHVGTYIGNGQVRGNNRVSYQQSGGKDPVGDVEINRLGKATGYVAAQELMAYLTGKVPVTDTPKAGNTVTPPIKPAPTPPDTTDKGGPFTPQQYARAQAILAAIEKAQKALQAKPGDAGLANALTAAQKESEKFSKSSLAAGDALKAAQAALGGAKSAAGSYVASLADLKKYGDTALRLIKDQEAAQKSGNAAQITAAEGAITRFSEQGKAQAAVLNAERAAYQSRQQLRDKEKSDSQALASQVAEIARDAAAGREADARAGLEQLKRSQQERLDLAQDDAGKRAAILRETGPAILNAEALIARRVREQAVRAAQDTATERLKVEGANAGEIEAQRRAAVIRAYAAEKTANATARSEQQQAERGAGRTAAEEQKRLASELAGLKIDSAKLTSDRLKLLADEDIRSHEGDLKKQLELTRRYSQQEFDRAELIARKTRDLAYQDAAGKPNEAALRKKADDQYSATVDAARVARLGTVRTATEAARKGQEAFNKTLDDGDAAGRAAIDSLKGLNLGGRELATTARTLTGTDGTFTELQTRISDLAADLDNPGVADAWIQAIDDMGKRGELTARQVLNLKTQVADLAGVEESLRNFGLRVSGVGQTDGDGTTTPGGQRYQTDNELRGIGQPVQEAADAYLNLESVIQDVGQFSRTELETLISQSGLAADQAERLLKAWQDVYGEFGSAATGPDATGGPGKGLLNNARPDDASQGTLAPGEADTLLASMIGMDPKELGAILADLVAKGFGESDLARLIRGHIQDTENAIRESLREFGGMFSGTGQTDESGVMTPGTESFMSDDQVRGIGVKSEEAQQAFIDLEGVIKNVMDLSRDELDSLLATAGLLPDQVEKVTAAWIEFNQAREADQNQSEQLSDYAVRLNGVFASLKDGSMTAGEARQALAGMRAELEGVSGDAAAQMRTSIDNVLKGFDELGGVSAQVTAALAKLRGESEKPYDALIRNLQKMRTEPGAAVGEIDQLIAKLDELNSKAARQEGFDKAISKINEYADYARKLLPAVTAAFKTFGMGDEVADAWGDSLGRMVDDVSNFAQSVVKILANPSDIGAWVAAFTQAITSIFTYFSRRAAEAKAEMKRTADYNNQFKFDKSGYGTRQVETRETGILWWKKTVYTEQVDEAGKALALSFENAVASGVGEGLREAVEKGDSSILEKSINSKIKDAAFSGLVEAFLNGPKIAEVLAPLIRAVMEAFKSGTAEDQQAALANLRDGVAGLRGEMDGLVEAGKAVDAILGDTGDSAAAAAEKARKLAEVMRDLAERRLNNDQTALDYQLRANLITVEAYEKKRYELALRGIQLRMDAELAAANLTAEQIALIHEKYALERQNAQLSYDQGIADRQRKVQEELLDNEALALELRHTQGLIDEEGYQAGLLAFALRRIEAERQAALAVADLTADDILRINEKYDLQGKLATARDEARKRQEAEAAAKEAQERYARQKEEQERAAKEAAEQKAAVQRSWREGLASGVSDFLNSGSPLDGIYRSLRGKIVQAVQDAWLDRAVFKSLDPLLDKIRDGIAAGVDVTGLIGQVGTVSQSVAAQISGSLGPLLAALNGALPNSLNNLTNAVNSNTDAVNGFKIQTTIVSYAPTPSANDASLRTRLAGLGLR